MVEEVPWSPLSDAVSYPVTRNEERETAGFAGNPKPVDRNAALRDTPNEQLNALLWGSLSKGGYQPPPPKTEALIGHRSHSGETAAPTLPPPLRGHGTAFAPPSALAPTMEPKRSSVGHEDPHAFVARFSSLVNRGTRNEERRTGRDSFPT